MPTDQSLTYRAAQTDLPLESVLFGSSSAMAKVRQMLENILLTDRPVLIQGESGTGKELVARFVHVRSKRYSAPFVRVNCAAMPSTLLESELFGSEKVTLGNCSQTRAGVLEIADGGTLFLDEIGALPHNLQEKLLQFLRDSGYTKMGGQAQRNASVRTICASNADLGEAVQSGRFCKDLYDQIAGISIELSALRKRKDDIPQLCEYFITKLASKFHRPQLRLSPETFQLLKQWDWPGNIRELENWVARAVILGDDQALGSELRKRIAAYRGGGTREHRIAVEATGRGAPLTASILRVLEANRWNRRKTATALHMSYRSLTYKLREVGIPRRRSHKGHQHAP